MVAIYYELVFLNSYMLGSNIKPFSVSASGDGISSNTSHKFLIFVVESVCLIMKKKATYLGIFPIQASILLVLINTCHF